LLGPRIRSKRTEKAMSLRELAERTGVTPSFLSLVERDRAEPSITTLRKIADALGVPIFYFLLNSEKDNPVVRKGGRKTIKFSESNLTFELLTPNLSGSIEMIMGTLGPGASTVEEPASHPGEECTLVLKGTMKIQIGGETYVLEEGDSIYYYSSLPHKLVNVGEGDLIFISAITPPQF